ncbi:hypothetical protein [Candidatus Nanohalococcus occultus]|uniref:hypothetical protein n=1 Tax=Candidatus Nanohalococcus occultus TaxID=2978047 RepID=UPI0039E047AE
MIKSTDLDGRTHQIDVREDLPGLVRKTDAYEQHLDAIVGSYRPGNEFSENPYCCFSENAEKLCSALESIDEELRNARHLLDNATATEAKNHIQSARENYREAQDAYEKLSSIESSGSSLEQDVADYLGEIAEGIDSVTELKEDKAAVGTDSTLESATT